MCNPLVVKILADMFLTIDGMGRTMLAMADRFASLCPRHDSCGCAYGGSCCLSCRLRECALIETPYSLAHIARADAIRAMRRAGVPRAMVADELGVSVRTVSRA